MTDMVEILRGLGMDDIAAEIERLRAELQEATQLVIKLQTERMIREVEDAYARGTVQSQEQRQSEADQRQGFGIIDNIPPSTPR